MVLLRKIEIREARTRYYDLDGFAKIWGVKLPPMSAQLAPVQTHEFDKTTDLKFEKAAMDALIRKQKEHGERQRTSNKN